MPRLELDLDVDFLHVLNRITISGFKSLRDPCSLRIAPLTLLAGANSAGKSSIIQPLLLLKQTQEATHDPGGLLLDGPCVRARTAEALLWRGRKKAENREVWSVELHYDGWRTFVVEYQRQPTGGFTPVRTIHRHDDGDIILEEGLSEEEIFKRLANVKDSLQYARLARQKAPAQIRRDRVSLYVDSDGARFFTPFLHFLGEDLLHLPGLRGNPERSYPVGRAEGPFPGTFQNYAASVLLAWQTNNDPRAAKVSDDLVRLGLTWKAEARRVSQSDTEVEIRVGRLPKARKGGSKDLVNIADVGFGVSQVLPVIVALHVAEPDQIVHIEQPELHLHPRAQVAMAALLIQAANRGVRVVVETHAPLLLMAIQLAVAKGEIPGADVSLNWFSRDEEGATQIREGQMDAVGAYDDWPVDFATVERELMRAYLDAALRDA